MTTRENFYAEALSETTTTSTTYGDQVALTATFANAADYVLFWTARLLNSSNTTVDAKLRLRNDTGAADLRLYNWETHDTSGDQYPTMFGIDKFTGAGASNTFSIEFAAESGTPTIKCKEAALFALRLSAADQYAEVEAAGSNTTTTYADQTTLTFTPATSGDYLIVASGSVRNSQAGRETYAQLLDSGTSTAYGAGSHATKDTTNWCPWSTAVRLTLAASSQTFKVQFKTADAAGETGQIRDASIVAIRLDAQANNYYSEARSNDATTSTSFQDKVTLTQTPTAADHLIIWFGLSQSVDSPDSSDVQLTEAGTTISLHEQVRAGGLATNIEPTMAFRKETLTATSTTWKIQHKTATGSGAGVNTREAGISILDLTDAGGGGGPTFIAARPLVISQSIGGMY